MGLKTLKERSAIDRMLASHGLGQLNDGAGLLSQLGFLVRDHEHFRSLLVRCEPEERSAMYDALTPYLRFPANELSWYIAESARLAEAKNLPTVDADGNYHWPSDARPTGLCNCKVISGVSMLEGTPVCRTCRRPFAPGQDLQATAQEAVNADRAKHFLTVHCRSCTREGVFYGETRADAVRNARLEGWVYYEHEGQPREICPECPASRKPMGRAGVS